MKAHAETRMDKYGTLLGWVTLAMILLSFITVVSRNLFSVVWIPVQELALYCHAFALMLGIVYAWHHDRHVRVDVFYQGFSEAKKKRINLLGTWFLMVPMMLFVIYSSYQYVIDSWMRLEGSGETGGLPLVFIFKTLLLLMPASMLGYVIVNTFSSNKKSRDTRGKN